MGNVSDDDAGEPIERSTPALSMFLPHAWSASGVFAEALSVQVFLNATENVD